MEGAAQDWECPGMQPRRAMNSSAGMISRLVSKFEASRRDLKYINAEANVLETYHDSFLFGYVPWSVRLRIFLRTGVVAYVWYLMEFILATLSGILYVYSTYEAVNQTWVTSTQHFISFAFVVDYMLRIYSEPARLYYMFSLRGLVDLLSLLPIFSVSRKNSNSRNDIFHLLQFIRIIRISSCMTKLGLAGSTLAQRIFLLVTATVGAVVLDAGIIQWIEYYAAPAVRKRQCSPGGCMSFWEAFYFVIVTMSTVGYGDVVPKTVAGQGVIIVTILVGIVILPIQISRISSLAHNRPYGGSFNSRKVLGSRFVILSGSLDLRVIQSFLAELYNPTHSEELEIYPLHVLILAAFSPSFELQQLISSYNSQVHFYEGSPSQPADLDRICASKASAFFLLADREASDTNVEDQAQILRALVVNRHCRSRVRIIVEVLEPDTQNSAVWDNTHGKGIELICQAKLHQKIMARSCAIRGLYTFITNLFTSEMQLRCLQPNHFMMEYNHSFDNEVYPLIFPSAFCGLIFEQVAEFIFASFNVVLFALDVPIGSQEETRKVLLHPKGHTIQPDDLGIVVAGNLSTVYSISKLESGLPNGYMSSQAADHPQSASAPLFERASTFGTDQLLDGSQLGNIPSSPVGHHKLKLAIGKACAGVQDDAGYEYAESSNRDSDSERPPGLEAALNDVLRWPLAAKYGRPHPLVLERNAVKIVQNLETRRLPVVALKKAHILVCCQGGWPKNLFYFLLELRKPTFRSSPVVILHRNDPTPDEWGLAGLFQDVFFVRGSPVYEVDLLRAGVLRAEKIVVLAYIGTPLDAGGKGVERTSAVRQQPGGNTSDVDCIVTLANIERLLDGDLTKVLVEMQNAASLEYLWPHIDLPWRRPAQHVDVLAHYAPAYMEGRALSPSMLNFLLRSSFYNKNTVSIVEQLVTGGLVETPQGVHYDQGHPRGLEQIPVPSKYVNQAYGDMFRGLLAEQGILALGLYRAKGTLASPMCYVFTNPRKEARVHEADLVFVLL